MYELTPQQYLAMIEELPTKEDLPVIDVLIPFYLEEEAS